MTLKPLLFVLSLSLPLGAFAQTGMVIAPSEAIVAITVGDLPVIISRSFAEGTRGTAFNYQIIAINDPTSYSASGLPAGLNLNTTTGRLSGTPTAVGVFSVDLTATNAAGSYSATITINISNYVDSDGDGIADEWELAYGLDPNDAADAALLSLAAGDGKTNLEAFQSGKYPSVLDLQDAPMPTPATGTYRLILLTTGNTIYGVKSTWAINQLPVPTP